jgi:hypothetical protein
MAAGGVDAQLRVSGKAGVIWESYSFDEVEGGLDYESVSQFSIPVVVDVGFGERTSLLISSGFARVQTSPIDGQGDLSVSGVLDTEARLSYEVVPSRLSLLVTGVLPTGITELDANQAPALNLITREVLDFSIARLGSGGGIGFGAVSAVPVGSFALGLGVTYRQENEYNPIAGGPAFQPGTQLRFRAGLEGPVGQTTYLRLAGIYGSQGAYSVGGQDAPDPGADYSFYTAVEHGVGATRLTGYAYAGGRTEPRIEPGLVGVTPLPESRTLVLGALWTLPVRRTDLVTPRFEYRANDFKPLPGGSESPEPADFAAFGRGLRLGVDYRLRAIAQGDLVLHTDYFTGDVRSSVVAEQGELVGTNGFRAGVRFEWRAR